MVELKTDKAPGGVQIATVTRDVRGSSGIFLVVAFACLIALLANCCAGQVNRGAPENSTNADLNSLGLSNGVLTPTFNSSTLSYLATVTNDISSVTVTPTSTDAGATITVQGMVVASGVTSQSITLNVGDNSIAIIVTAANGTTTKVYTIVTTRAVGASANADLSSLALSSGTLSPSFSSAVTSYSVSVAGSVSSVTVTPTAAAAGASNHSAGTRRRIGFAIRNNRAYCGRQYHHRRRNSGEWEGGEDLYDNRDTGDLVRMGADP